MVQCLTRRVAVFGKQVGVVQQAAQQRHLQFAKGIGQLTVDALALHDVVEQAFYRIGGVLLLL